MSHSHAHNHADASTSFKRLFITMLLNFLITVTEIVGGIWSGSLSLISDALHNFSDGLAIIISAIALKLNRRPASPMYTFGLKRAEILAAVINSSTLIVICFFLFREAYERFLHPQPVTGGIMIGVASIGMVANVAGTALLHKGSQSSMNLRSVYLHLLSDAFSSMAVILGGIAIYFYEIYWLDPALTVLISLYILWESVKITREAVKVIMMATPAGFSLEEIARAIRAVPGVSNVHHIHLWQLDEHDVHFEAHVEVDDMRVSETGAILKEIQSRLRDKFGISHVTIQFENNVCAEKDLLFSGETH